MSSRTHNAAAQTTAQNAGVVKISSGGAADRFWNPRFWDGVGISAWIKLLNAGGWRVSPLRWPMFGVISCLTGLNSTLAALQRARFGAKLSSTELVGAPIFIIGHWRSGTTLLHEYLMRDDQFACSDTYECFAPAHFLVSSAFIRPWLRFLMPSKRPMDNMAAGLDRPQEDEFALAVLGLNTPYRNVAFPNNKPIDEDYLTLRNLSDAERERWLDALEYFLKALTIAKRKTVVLKSPPHTARIRALLSRFPNAKFVHISRDPYVLFPSTVNLWMKLARTHGLQIPKGGEPLQKKVLDDFERMYDAYFDDLPLLKKGSFAEISYDELVAAPVQTLERIYRELELDGFESKREIFEKFADSQKNYKKNKFEIAPEIKETIAARWKKYIERYATDRDDATTN
ncbi:MAG: sulfotransferase [Thermoguttaceae bacterium]|nr:sulfotransferase [Thermoguttaceae bacterium]